MKLEPDAGVFKGFTVATRCGWDNRAPNNCKFGHSRSAFTLTLQEQNGLIGGIMAEVKTEDTLVIIKPDSFWRKLNRQVEARLNALGLTVVAECILADGGNLPEEKWREFYFPVIGDRPPCLEGTSKYMAHGPVKVIQLRGEGAIQKVRKAVGATRPWQADPGTIRGDFWPGAVEANAPYRLKFQQPGDDQFLFNMIHASDSEKSFAREVHFFDKLKAPGQTRSMS
jgi:nucleoside-diphosphate kinase